MILQVVLQAPSGEMWAKTSHTIVWHESFQFLPTVSIKFRSRFTHVFPSPLQVHVVSATEFEMVLYLNQMGVFNFVDDGTLYPGQSALKLNDGRKRSMSLWVEFITASGYLSARKIRSRFQVTPRF